MTDNTANLGFAGQVLVESAEIQSTRGFGFNVINQMAYVELFEDILSPFLTGTVALYESLDLINLFPLVGEEIFHLKFITPSLDTKFARDARFYIYKITDVEAAGDRAAMYLLHFISLEAIVSVNTKISKTFEGKVSDIVKKLLIEPTALNTKKPIQIEDTQNVTKFTANYWTPMKCINYMTSTAANFKGSASYIYFENAQGIHFVSLASLYEQKLNHIFVQNNYSRDIKGSGSAVKEPMKDYIMIKRLSIPVGFDYIDRSLGGMYGSQLITVDPITKRYSSKLYNTVDNFNRQSHLNKYSLISDSALARSQQAMLYVPKHYNNFNGYVDVTNASVIQQRTALIKTADAFKVTISVFGRSDYTVGQKALLKIPAKDALNISDPSDEHLDKVVSGNYLISAIRHKITRVSHEIDMELIKDSLLANLNKGSFK